MNRILVTGGAGFIGHHFVEHLLKNTNWEVIVLDKLNYASSGFDRLRDIQVFDDRRVKIFSSPVDHPIEEGLEQEVGQVDYIVHMAAETHVDNSITNPLAFVESNVLGTFHMLEFARRQKNLKKFVMFSTDEVYGPAPDGVFYKETDRHNPGNPYSASKSAGEQLCLAWSNTYKVPTIISNTMNVYGERQHPEKFIPKTVKNVLQGNKVIIHGTPDRTRAGSRFYIHARNVSAAALFLLQNTKGTTGEAFNIVGECEVDNLTLAQTIANVVGKKLDYEIVDFHSSRPGHDLRYALDGSKLASMGYTNPVNFHDSLHRTIEWSLRADNLRWLGL